MLFVFGDYRLDTRLLELSGPAGPVALEPKCLSLLRFLLTNRDRAVSKDQIFDAVWPGVIVTEASLSTAIRQIRVALGDDGDRQSMIKTVRGHGYRFVAEVSEMAPALVSGRESPPDRGIGKQRTRGDKPTIAIRPFQLIGADERRQAIAEAIPAELIATLSRLRWINVIARGSSFRFSPSNADLTEMAKGLGAQYVVSGIVEWQNTKLIVYVELSDARTGDVIWSERLTGKIDDVYELRARAARELAIALELRVPMHEADRLRMEPSANLDAWGHFHLGIRHMYRYNRDDNEIAAGHFRRAIELDAEFSRAHSGLSYTEFQNAFQHFKTDPGRHGTLALGHAEKAMQLDPLDPFCNLIYGRAKWLLGDAENGIVWVDRSIELNPNYAFGYYNNATLNTVLCNGRVADENVGTALTLSPIDPHLQSMYGTRALAAFVSEDLAAATRFADRALNAPNPHLYVFIIAAAIYSHTGNLAKAENCVEAIRAKKVGFGTTEFLTHFNLRDADKLRSLKSALRRFDI